MTPLAAVSVAAARGELPDDSGAPRVIAHPLIAAGALTLAVGELAGDNQKTAPDRIVPVGLTARLVTSALAGAALVPHRRRWWGAAVGGATALVSSYVVWRLRIAAITRYGQTAWGFAEDAMAVGGAMAIVRASR